MNDSSSGGVLAPSGQPPVLNDDPLVDVYSALISGLTGITRQYVRPRWQPVAPPNQPDINTNWVALGITAQTADTFAYVGHVATINGGAGGDVMTRHEQITLLCSFYGPNAAANASLVRDGLSIAQNREALQLIGVGLISVGDIKTTTEQLNNQFYRRLDMPINSRRAVTRTYAVLNLLGATGTAHTSNGLTRPITVTGN